MRIIYLPVWATRLLLASSLLSSLLGCREPDLFTSHGTSQSVHRQAIAAEEKRVPAEWEAHESIWMAWPTYHNKHDWDAEATYAQLLQALITKVPVELCVADAAMQQKVQAYLQAKGIAAGQFGSRIRFRIMNYQDIWLRDTGPIFVQQGKQLLAVDFNFDGWGWGGFVKDPEFSDFLQLEEGVDRSIAQMVNVTPVKSKLTLEGGALEFNGQGTVIVSEDVVFQRNPGWNKLQVEAEFRRLFSTRKVIWLTGFMGNDAHPVINSPYQMAVQETPQPVYTLMTTNGHTDAFVRFTSSNTVLLAQPPSEQEAAQDPVVAQNRKTLLEAQRVLSTSTDQDNQPLQIRYMPETRSMLVKLDEQDKIYQLMTFLNFEREGKTNIDPTKPITGVLASSYLNYLVTNNLVLVAKYAELYPDMAAKDAQAIQVLQQAFPGRQVVAIDARAINVGGGGIHCITRQMPKTEVPAL
ncbi:agmatine deiminase family protein [Adhaeribacter pallidiroseus]|uniref:Agmatine deiminase n=1 Tax=Adhaeribacter pallidiroseus TaxID=2072847 RepID=A0A369QPI0_9BACT|nr:agmatine deiminase family protein [Adhaeribacter pallidiroseus]RDC66232.1 Agmatine deiminase [Adhaeribacter pallidiroseus]